MAPWPYVPTSHKFRQPLMLWLRLTRDASHACIIIAKSGANISQTIADYKKNLDYCRGVVQQFWIFFYLPWSRGPPQIGGPEAMSASSPLILAQWGISRKLWLTLIGYTKNDNASSDLQTPLPLLEFFPIGNGLYLIVTTNKIPLRNGNYPITEMGVAHTVGQYDAASI